MNRDDWKFRHTAAELAMASLKKKEHHEGRAAWWKDQRELAMQKLKAEGIEIDDSLAADGVAARFSTSNHGRGPTVQFKTGLVKDLEEAHGKVKEHEGKAKVYDSWHQVMHAQAGGAYDLEHDDWIFFFGK